MSIAVVASSSPNQDGPAVLDGMEGEQTIGVATVNGAVRAAFRFVLHDLTETERTSALVASPPHSFDFTDPATAIRVQEMLKESR